MHKVVYHQLIWLFPGDGSEYENVWHIAMGWGSTENDIKTGSSVPLEVMILWVVIHIIKKHEKSGGHRE